MVEFCALLVKLLLPFMEEKSTKKNSQQASIASISSINMQQFFLWLIFYCQSNPSSIGNCKLYITCGKFQQTQICSSKMITFVF